MPAAYCHPKSKKPVDVYCREQKSEDEINNQLEWLKAIDSQGLNPLHLACKHGHVGVVQELLAVGADVHMTAKVSRLYYCFGFWHVYRFHVTTLLIIMSLQFTVSTCCLYFDCMFRPRACC